MGYVLATVMGWVLGVCSVTLVIMWPTRDDDE